MPIDLGGKPVIAISLGSKPVIRVSLGPTHIWTPAQLVAIRRGYSPAKDHVLSISTNDGSVDYLGVLNKPAGHTGDFTVQGAARNGSTVYFYAQSNPQTEFQALYKFSITDAPPYTPTKVANITDPSNLVAGPAQWGSGRYGAPFFWMKGDELHAKLESVGTTGGKYWIRQAWARIGTDDAVIKQTYKEASANQASSAATDWRVAAWDGTYWYWVSGVGGRIIKRTTDTSWGSDGISLGSQQWIGRAATATDTGDYAYYDEIKGFKLYPLDNKLYTLMVHAGGSIAPTLWRKDPLDSANATKIATFATSVGDVTFHNNSSPFVLAG